MRVPGEVHIVPFLQFLSLAAGAGRCSIGRQGGACARGKTHTRASGGSHMESPADTPKAA